MPSPTKKKRNGGYHAIIRDVFVCSRAELAQFAVVFSFSPENFEQQKFGTLFGIIKIDDRSENSSYVANLLVSVVKKEYFGKPHRTPEESFEAGLRKANLALAELARQGSTSWTGKLSFAGGAIERNNLHFACLGDASIFLVRAGEIAEISEKLEEEKESESHPLKTFSNVSSGKIEIGDKIIFCTRELEDIFSREEILQNAQHFSREEFPGFLEISLQANSELAGAIVVDFADAAEEKISAALIEETRIDDIFETIPENRPGSQELASPNRGEPAKKIDSFAGTKKPRKNEAFIRDSDYKKSDFVSGPAPVEPKWKSVLLSLAELAKKMAISALRFAKNIPVRESASRISGKAKSVFTKTKNSFSGAAPPSGVARRRLLEKPALVKIVAGITIALVLYFSVSAFLKSRNSREEPSQETAPATESTSVPQNLDDVNVKNIENIEQAADFSTDESRIALLDGNIFAVSGKDKTVARVNPETKTIEEFKSNLPVGNFELITAMPHLKTIFILTGERKVVSFTPINKNFQENAISLPENLKSQDIRTYLTYLYVLDTAASQIYRFPRSEGGFGERQSWLRETTDLKNAKSIAINDDLYIAENGNITAYLQGKKDGNINFESPQTPLSIDRIFSEPEMEFVWILDGKNRRIVKYSKDGKIIAQYFNPDISAARDLFVDEKNKTVYLLKNNQLLKFSAE
jgi:serine/threonine protein phosphatase PrpC